MKARALLELSKEELDEIIKDAPQVKAFFYQHASWTVLAVRYQINHYDDEPSGVVGVIVEVGPPPEEEKE